MSKEIQCDKTIRPNVGRRGLSNQFQNIQETTEFHKLRVNECVNKNINKNNTNRETIIQNKFSNETEAGRKEENPTRLIKTSNYGQEKPLPEEKPETLKILVKRNFVTKNSKTVSDKKNKTNATFSPSINLPNYSKGKQNESRCFPDISYNKKYGTAPGRKIENCSLNNKYLSTQRINSLSTKQERKDNFENYSHNTNYKNQSHNYLSLKNCKFNSTKNQNSENQDYITNRILHNNINEESLEQPDGSCTKKYGEEKLKPKQESEKIDQIKKSISIIINSPCNSAEKSEWKNNRVQSKTNIKSETDNSENKMPTSAGKIICFDKNSGTHDDITQMDKEIQTEGLDLILEKAELYKLCLSLLKKQNENLTNRRKNSYTIIEHNKAEESKSNKIVTTNSGDCSLIDLFLNNKQIQTETTPVINDLNKNKEIKKINFKNLSDSTTYECFSLTHSIGINTENRLTNEFTDDLLPSNSNETYVIPNKFSSESDTYLYKTLLPNTNKQLSTNQNLNIRDENECNVNSEQNKTNKNINFRIIRSEKSITLNDHQRKDETNNMNYTLMKSTAFNKPTLKLNDRLFESNSTKKVSFLINRQRTQNEPFKRSISLNRLNDETNQNKISESTSIIISNKISTILINSYLKKMAENKNIYGNYNEFINGNESSINNKNYNEKGFINKNIKFIKTINQVDSNNNNNNNIDNNKKNYHNKEFINKNIKLIKTINEENMRKKELKSQAVIRHKQHIKTEEHYIDGAAKLMNNNEIKNTDLVQATTNKKSIVQKIKREMHLNKSEPLVENMANIYKNDEDQTEESKNEEFGYNRLLPCYTCLKPQDNPVSKLKPELYHETHKKHYLTEYKQPESDYKHAYNINFYEPTNEKNQFYFQPKVYKDSFITHPELSDEDTTSSSEYEFSDSFDDTSKSKESLNKYNINFCEITDEKKQFYFQPNLRDDTFSSAEDRTSSSECEYSDWVQENSESKDSLNEKSCLRAYSNSSISKEKTNVSSNSVGQSTNDKKIDETKRNLIPQKNVKMNKIVKSSNQSQTSMENTSKLKTEGKNNNQNESRPRKIEHKDLIRRSKTKKECKYIQYKNISGTINNLSKPKQNTESVVKTNDIKTTQNKQVINTESNLRLKIKPNKNNEEDKNKMKKKQVIMAEKEETSYNEKIRYENLVINDKDTCGILLKNIDEDLLNNANYFKKITIISKASYKPSHDNLCWKGVRYHEADILKTKDNDSDKKKNILQWMKSWFN